MYKTTIHGNYSVTYWSVYRQVWTRRFCQAIPDDELATLPTAERAAIEALCDGIRPAVARAIMRNHGR